MMTRQDFQAIADALKGGRPIRRVSGDACVERWEIIVFRMASMCEDQNPRFDRSRFLRACGHGEDA